jgi:lysophospholipase L1-like esterase
VAHLIAVMGDSISAGTPGWDPNPAIREAKGRDNVESQWEYWAARRHPGLTFHNHGVGGERTDEIAARLETDVGDVDHLVVQGGINDIVQGRNIEHAASDVRLMVQWGKRRGLQVTLADVLPWNNGRPGAAAEICSLNEAIHRIGQDEHVRVLPFYATLQSPEEPGRMRADWTADGNHPSVLGHRRLGELAFVWP